MSKYILTLSTFVVIFLLSSTTAFAHVVVKPNQVNVATFQTFDMGVPSEKDMPTIALRLLIPHGLEDVTPNVKPGWTIDVKKEGDTVTEINWTGGSIPPHQRDEFLFQAQVPTNATTLKWKAYQTYADGSVVAWDKDPQTIKKGEEGTAYSQTKVINDLINDTASTKTQTSEANKINYLTWFSGTALVLSIAALALAIRKK